MIGDESGFSDGKLAAATFHSVKRLRFLQYIAGMLAAFLRPAPMRAMEEGRQAAPVAAPLPDLPGGRLPLTGEMAGPGLQATMQRKPALTNRIRAPRVFYDGPSRRDGFAIIGGSLGARLSHRPAGRGGKTGGTPP